MTQYLFVYGTLRAKSRHPMARRLAREARWVGAATLQGKLYHLGAYPGVVLSPHSCDTVWGDLYYLRHRRLLQWLDEYEGCTGAGDRGAEYQRAKLEVIACESGEVTTAWGYLYRRPVCRLRQIPSGDWLRVGNASR